MPRLPFLALCLGFLAWVPAAFAATWTSPVTGQALTLELLPALDPAPPAKRPLVLYLLNLAAPRVGTASDTTILHELRAAGFSVVTIDYAKHPRARMPWINRDLGRLRDELRARTFPIELDRPVDPARIFIVPAGHTVKRDVLYYGDATRPLSLDLVYPTAPAAPTGTVLEFSCDNENRLGNTSLSICSDTLLDGFATEGVAVAMADHPVAPPYKGLDAMPDCAWRIKAAVRTLRATTTALGLGERIVPAGFSRGSGMALMLVSTEGIPKFENHGEHPAVSSAVQGAIILSGRFTYLDLLPGDKMVPRYDKAWGTFAAAPDVWRQHGALDYLAQAPAMPLFLSINATEAPDALHQMKVLRRRLADLGADATFLMEREPRGHKVPLDEALLEQLRRYVHDRFDAMAPVVTRQP